MRNVLDITCGENPSTHFMFSIFFFFRKSCRSRDDVEKYGEAREIVDDKMEARCMLD
jgi:hypothetical protein